MFNIGIGELAIICIVLIIAVGPDRLPSMMKTLGKTVRTLRQASRDIRASTGIDELLREDLDLNAPMRRRPVPPAGPPPVSRAEVIDVAAVPVATPVVSTPTPAAPAPAAAPEPAAPDAKPPASTDSNPHGA
jgi:sec-independent protein translocase protein TatB